MNCQTSFRESVKFLNFEKMAKRGKISFHIKRKIAEHFEKNGFDKQSRKSAIKIYDDLSESENAISR